MNSNISRHGQKGGRTTIRLVTSAVRTSDVVNTANANPPIELLLIAGVAVILFCALGFWIRRRTYRRWTKTSGTVIELVRQTNPQNETSLYPKISFRALSGETIEFISSVSSPGPAVGDTVAVIYDPKNPKDAEQDGFFNRYGGLCILCLFGVAAIIVYLVKKLSH